MESSSLWGGSVEHGSKQTGDMLKEISTGYRYVASVATLAFIPTISISVWSMQINNETYGYIM